MNRDPITVAVLYVWPVIFGASLIMFGISKPPDVFGAGLFGAALPRGSAFIAAGVIQALSVVSQRAWVRALALGAATLVLLGRVATLAIVGVPDLSRRREIGVLGVWWGWWAAVVLVHFLSTPDAVREQHHHGRCDRL